MSTASISKSRIRKFFKAAVHRIERWNVVFDCIWNGAHEGRLVDTYGETIFYWDVDPNGWLCVCIPATWEGAGPLYAYAKLDAKRPRWHYL